MRDSLVTIVVTTKNEEKNIENCLRSIQSQSWKQIEVIVVDNYSFDNTINIAKNYTNQVYTFGPERSAQRNFGMIEKSSGKYLMYIDADMILSPSLVEGCVKHINENDYDALYINEYILGNNLFSKARNFERSFYSGTVIDAARFFKRNIFIASNGFDEITFKEGSGEDWDLDKSIRRIGGKIGMLPNMKNLAINKNKSDNFSKLIGDLGGVYNENNMCIYHNESTLTIANYIKKKLYYSKGFKRYIDKWGKNDNDIKKQLGFKYRYFKVFYENKKWTKLIRHPFLYLIMFYIRIRVGFAYIKFIKYDQYRKTNDRKTNSIF